MKIRSDIRAGNALRDCQRQRDYWKGMAMDMEAIANQSGGYNPQPQPQPLPQPTQPPTNPPGGGWVGGVWYGDRSGWCG